MFRRSRPAALALAAIALSGPPLAAQFGDLPAGQVDRHLLEAVRAEIGVFFFLDSTTVAGLVPAGMHLTTLQQIADLDPASARYLAARPYLRTAVPSILAFAALDSFQIADGPVARYLTAFWWLPVAPTDSLDPRTRGAVFVEVANWSSDSALVRQLGREWPQVRQAPVSMERGTDGAWRLDLTLPNGRIHGRCLPSGVRASAGYELPAYSTIWGGGAEARSFTIYTYYGHQSQDCAATWTSEGTGVLPDALRNYREDPPWVKSTLEDGWHARAGLYRR